MKFSILAAVVALAAGVQATGYSNSSAATTTEVVTAYTTYCPQATQLTLGGKTITVSSATTLTLTDGPYTVVKTLTSKVVSDCGSCASPTVTPAAPGVTKPSNGSSYATPTRAATPSISVFTGAANAAAAGSGFFAAVMGFAIMAL